MSQIRLKPPVTSQETWRLKEGDEANNLTPCHYSIRLTASSQGIREWCKDVFSQWGFTPEEVEYLDKMRGAGGK